MMTINQNKVVSVNYHLSSHVDNEAPELVEQTTTEHPFTFIFGVGQLLPDFEKNLLNKKVGDKFDFKVTPINGYGVSDKEMIAKIPKEAFHVDGEFDSERVKEGEELMMNDADGNQLMGFVQEIGNDYVIMDFNHPLADHNLHFVGEVLSIREATAEELDHGHVHGPGGHHH
ncbi:MAG: FKBP-type peptidyl-prolyl cis-trans isomerase [Bacteroidia bacterium]|nr:FKBP-type peptidyl-prolyl cis-trans isomerase [Bacteroidia bacterium]